MGYEQHYRIRPGLLGYIVEERDDKGGWAWLNKPPGFATREEAETALRRMIKEGPTFYNAQGENT